MSHTPSLEERPQFVSVSWSSKRVKSTTERSGADTSTSTDVPDVQSMDVTSKMPWLAALLSIRPPCPGSEKNGARTWSVSTRELILGNKAS